MPRVRVAGRLNVWRSTDLARESTGVEAQRVNRITISRTATASRAHAGATFDHLLTEDGGHLLAEGEDFFALESQ
jgi:hypothetical protein